MFGGDPGKSLNKARRLLAEGDPLGALRLARKAQGRARPPLSGEIAALVEEARRAVVAAAAERAEASAANGYYDDAAEWLRGGMDHAEGEEERARLAARLRELEDRAEAAAESRDEPSRWSEGGPRGEEPDAGEGGGEEDEIEPAGRHAGGGGLETLVGGAPRIEVRVVDSGSDAGDDGAAAGAALPLDERYEAFVDFLRDDVAPRYRDRPPEFRRGIVDFADPDDADAARTAIETLAEAAPDDPVLRLERGRWRLAQGDAAGARADLEAAWAEFGDEALDIGGVVSIPEMWCEAALAAGDHAAVLERLEERRELTLEDPELSLYYAQALLAAGEDAEARDFLAESHERFPRRPDVAHLLAVTLHHGGAAADAARVLERSLRACGPGCSPADLQPPSLRLLATIYAEAGGPVERLGDVLLLLRGAQGGELQPTDWRLQARYHDLAGEPEAAERARTRAGIPAGTRWSGEGPPPAPAYEEDRSG